ncbi:hypothetical protein [uncultured Desulfobacter sp.]|nr:hypothetical protein [uncultured Desulfobacter sp.]
MMIDRQFQEQIPYINLESINSSLDIIYIIDQEMRLKGHNRAWDSLA